MELDNCVLLLFRVGFVLESMLHRKTTLIGSVECVLRKRGEFSVTRNDESGTRRNKVLDY